MDRDYHFSTGFPTHHHGNEPFRLDGTVSSYPGVQPIPNSMYSQNFTGGYAFPKYERMSPHTLLPPGEMVIPQHPESTYNPISFPSASANPMLHLPTGHDITQSTNSGFAPFSFGNSLPTNLGEQSIPQMGFSYPSNLLMGGQTADFNNLHNLGLKAPNLSCQKSDRLSPTPDAMKSKTKSRSISPHIQNVTPTGHSSPLIDVHSLSNSESPQKPLPWDRQDYGKENTFQKSSGQDTVLPSMPSLGTTNPSFSVGFDSHQQDQRATGSPFDLSLGACQQRSAFSKDPCVLTTDSQLHVQNMMPVNSMPKEMEHPSDNTDSMHNLNNDYKPSGGAEQVEQKGYGSESKVNNDGSSHVRFFIKGKLARKSYYERYSISKNFVDASFECDKDEAVRQYFACAQNMDTSTSTQGLFNLIQNLNDLVFPTNAGVKNTPPSVGFDKELGSAHKRKMRQPSFLSPSSMSTEPEKKEVSKKIVNSQLNEEYLVKDSGSQESLSPDDKKGRQRQQPFAITSPSFSKAAARAVMTTSVANNATVVTISIANKGGGEKGRGWTSNGTPSTPGKHKDNNGMPSTPGKYKESGDTTEEDKSSDNSSPESGAEDVKKEIGIEKTSIMSGLRNLQDKDTPRRRLSENCVIEESSDRMEINVRIDDSQLIQHGDIKRWQCHMCPKSYTTKHNLVTHVLDHNGIKPHLCMVCGKYFKQLSHLNTHMLTHDNIKPHICSICNKGFTQISHLKRHMTVHQESRPYHCDICNRGFAYPSELRAHRERHTSDKENKCVDCGEEFESQKALRQHQVKHGDSEDLRCKYCSKVFRYPSQLKDHIITHEGTRPYICGECGMDFMKEHHLKSHQFTHSGKRPWVCPQCGRAFNQKANMQRHMLIHNSQRSFKCEKCGKTFTQPQTLKAHMVVHAEKKPYECKFCGKQFGRLHNLQGHMHMHNDTKPYICFCGSSFTLKGNLNRHKKVKHGLNETTESMEEDAVNFLSELSERSVASDSAVYEEEEEETSEHSSSESKSPRKARKSIPRKYNKNRTNSVTDDNDGSHSEQEEPVDVSYQNFVSKYFKPQFDGEEREESRKRKRKPSRVSLSEEDFSNEFSDTDIEDDNGEREREPDEQGDATREGDDSPERPAKKQKSANLDSIIATKFNV